MNSLPSLTPYTRSTAGFPSNVHDEAMVIRSSALHVQRLARAAATLGNDRLADDLYDIAATLEGAELSIREHIMTNCRDGYQQAINGVGGVLSAMARRIEKEKTS